MPRLSFVTLDVFTTTRFAGNPLAVVLVPPRGGGNEAGPGAAAHNELSTAHMQRIAREFNLSETVFLHERNTPSPDEDEDHAYPEWRMRIFLTHAEVPFAGHPTIGTACYALGHLISSTTTRTSSSSTSRCRLVCNAGPIEITYDRGTGIARAAIPHNVHIHTENPFTTSDLLALQPGLKDSTLRNERIAIVSPVKGMNFICARLDSLEDLGRVDLSAKPRPKLDREWDTGFAGSYFYVITASSTATSDQEEQTNEVKLRTRMIEGSFEDPATGSAACGLAAYLALQGRPKGGSSERTTRVSRFEITQAVEMGRQSDIGVVVTLTPGLDAVETIELSGASVRVMEGSIESV